MRDTKMKKVLILAYDFPPYVSVGGLRPYNWFIYLNEYGIDPVVVTRQWANNHGNELDYIAPSSEKTSITEHMSYGTVIRTPYRPNLANRIMLQHGYDKWNLVRRSISAFFEFAQFFLPIGPKRNLYLSAREFLKKERVDCIIATGDPFILFKYANDLSREFQIPWIADYRDPWSQSFSAKKGFLQKKYDLWNEKRIVNSCELILTVDELFKLKLLQIFPTKKVFILPNGYDPKAMERIKQIDQEKTELTFSFVGTIYKWHPIDSLLSTFLKFKEKNPAFKFCLKFYGINDEEELKEKINSTYKELHTNIQILSRIPNGELLEKLALEHVMILFNYYQFTGTKIYDYLGIKRKILLCFTDDPKALELKTKYYFKSLETDIQPQIDMVTQTNSGIIVKDQEHLLIVLEDLWKEFSETGQIACDSHGVEKYSRKVQVERLASLLGTFPSSGREHSK
jgi:glycosyltransferase involved in cell wall biosynthesis